MHPKACMRANDPLRRCSQDQKARRFTNRTVADHHSNIQAIYNFGDPAALLEDAPMAVQIQGRKNPIFLHKIFGDILN